MAEPASSTAGALAFAATTVTVTGSVMGIQYDALLAGFAGGLISLSYLPSMPAARTAGTVASSTIVAGFLAPLVAAAATHYFSWLNGLGPQLRMACAFGLGVSAQVLIPTVLNMIRKRGDAQ